MLPLEWKYPQAVLAERQRVAAQSDMRGKILFDLAGRPPYAWGLLTAAEAAKFFGIKRFTAIEFGVADGGGLLELSRLAEVVSQEVQVAIDVVGFDNGSGLPAPLDYRDHPEIWSSGDFAMANRESLYAQLPSGSRLILGDVKDTVRSFLVTLSRDAPIGFCSFDVDLYSSTMSALKIYGASAEFYLPVGVAYFDDTIGGAGGIGSLCRNIRSGQLLAIEEFNAATNDRVIDSIRTLRYRRPLSQEQWLDQVYGVHVLDHPLRNYEKRKVPATMQQHAVLADLRWRL